MEWVWCGVVCEGGGRKLFWLMAVGSFLLEWRQLLAYGSWQFLIHGSNN
jgi:hypothetical protein